VHGYPAMGTPLTTMRASLISDDGETGIYLAQSLLDGSSMKCTIIYNDTLCAEEGEEEDATEAGVPKGENRTANFEIIGLEERAWWLASAR
jgi:hypothetical protein